MKGNFARRSYNPTASTPAGRRQNVLGVDAFALEPNSVNDNPHSSHHLCTQGPRLEKSGRSTEHLRPTPARHVFGPPIPRYAQVLEDHLPFHQSFKSRFHLFHLLLPFKLTHSSHIDYITPTSTVRYGGTYLYLLPPHA
ncbi:hypothetical protein BDN70DRAFT_887121 [Pholiota conissans]|uniref:Uncharacterized protein n=1 Tax=Pholiota conissans TaxID=109636 RepID=A0A9P6CMI8_9AGAR|nr:hypothetical protein BDN70DRAFT_887121 [Pholiota conissans]